MTRVCLLTPGQPSTNPRLVKEADALTEAGCEVVVICGYWAAWADAADRSLLATRSWTCRYVGGHPDRERARYHWTRMRHYFSRRWGTGAGPETYLGVSSLGRVAPDLIRAAQGCPGDLFIAHNLPALPAAVLAARRHRAKAGYDAEDLIPAPGDTPGASGLHDKAQRLFLPQCDYLTAASAGMAQAYARRFGLGSQPVVVHNVFPLNMRPGELRFRSPSQPLTLYWFSQTIGKGRGLESVLEAMAQTQAPCHLHLRGEWQAGYRESFYRQARRLRIASGRLFWNPPDVPDEMARLASLYDVGLAVEPGRDENNDLTVSNKIFTYLLAGNAVAATGTRGQEEVCRELGEAAFCYRPQDSRALAAQLDAWFQVPEQLERARRKAWQLGTERFNWDREKHRFLSVVEEALK